MPGTVLGLGIAEEGKADPVPGLAEPLQLLPLWMFIPTLHLVTQPETSVMCPPHTHTALPHHIHPSPCPTALISPHALDVATSPRVCTQRLTKSPQECQHSPCSGLPALLQRDPSETCITPQPKTSQCLVSSLRTTFQLRSWMEYRLSFGECRLCMYQVLYINSSVEWVYHPAPFQNEETKTSNRLKWHSNEK